jgi:hypothetical protein
VSAREKGIDQYVPSLLPMNIASAISKNWIEYWNQFERFENFSKPIDDKIELLRFELLRKGS